jgi:hypothetical protein
MSVESIEKFLEENGLQSTVLNEYKFVRGLANFGKDVVTAKSMRGIIKIIATGNYDTILDRYEEIIDTELETEVEFKRMQNSIDANVIELKNEIKNPNTAPDRKQHYIKALAKVQKLSEKCKNKARKVK